MKPEFRRFVTVCASGLLLGATPAPHLQVSADGLTVHAEAVPLSEILLMLGRQTRLTSVLMVETSVLQTNLVTEHFSNLPLERGIHRLLNDWSYVLVSEAGSGAIKLYILDYRDDSVRASEAEPSPAGAAGYVADTKKAREADMVPGDDPEAPQTGEVLRLQLQSGNPADRLDALNKMASAGGVGDLGLEDIRRLAEQDPDPRVRTAALDSLILFDPSDEAMQVLRNLAEGSDEKLREIAVGQLEHMDEATAITARVAQDSKY